MMLRTSAGMSVSVAMVDQVRWNGGGMGYWRGVWWQKTKEPGKERVEVEGAQRVELGV